MDVLARFLVNSSCFALGFVHCQFQVGCAVSPIHSGVVHHVKSMGFWIAVWFLLGELFCLGSCLVSARCLGLCFCAWFFCRLYVLGVLRWFAGQVSLVVLYIFVLL